MNLSDAINHASTIFMPEFLFGMGDDAYRAERAINEEAISLLTAEFFAKDDPGFGFDLILDLADRNRVLCDMLETEDDDNDKSPNLPRSLTDEDTIRAIAALQHRDPTKIKRKENETLGILYASRKIKGTVLGIDIETTSTSPDRGRIINIGWELIKLEPGAEPYDAQSVYCGLPDEYAEKGVPLAQIHKITWDMVKGEKEFYQDKQLQKTLLALMKKYPYLAHNAAFEDSWFTYNLAGYAEARKAGKIVPVDTRTICRELDPETKRLPWDTHPASLEAWARRRGTLSDDEEERHLGLEDTDLMLRTVIAELTERNLF